MGELSVYGAICVSIQAQSGNVVAGKSTPVMTATLTILAPEISKEEQKARRKEEKKRFNKQLATLGQGFDNLTHAIYGAQDRVAEARKAGQCMEGMEAPTQALSDYLNALDALLAQGMEMAQEQGQPAQEAAAEHLFPGRAAKWAAQDEQNYHDARYAQQERYAGYTGY